MIQNTPFSSGDITPRLWFCLALLGITCACAPLAADQIPANNKMGPVPPMMSSELFGPPVVLTNTAAQPATPLQFQGPKTNISDARLMPLKMPETEDLAEKHTAIKNPSALDENKILEREIQVEKTHPHPPSDLSETQRVPGYILGSGDTMRINVFGEAELSNSYTVDAGGFIAMPLIGDVKLAGLTLREAEDAIAAQLANGYLISPSVSIEVSQYRPFYIMGEVRAPGSYPYVANMTVLNAVAMAGGFTYRARQSSVEIMSARPGAAKQYTDAEPEELVYPGDIIVVEERFF
jgi:protein involved in polysaccharide export with SLBB domain